MNNFLNDLKKHLLTAISYMLPLVVAAGLLIAIGNLTGGQVVKEFSQLTIPSALTTLGVFGMGFCLLSLQAIQLIQLQIDQV